MKKLRIAKEVLSSLTPESQDQVAAGQPLSFLSLCLNYCYTEVGPRCK